MLKNLKYLFRMTPLQQETFNQIKRALDSGAYKIGDNWTIECAGLAHVFDIKIFISPNMTLYFETSHPVVSPNITLLKDGKHSEIPELSSKASIKMIKKHCMDILLNAEKKIQEEKDYAASLAIEEMKSSQNKTLVKQKMNKSFKG